jgi:signal transduction histidine kinase
LVNACDCLETDPQYKNLCKILDHTLDEVHSMAVQLRPASLDDLGLEAALERYLSEWESQHEIKLDFAIHTDGHRLPEVIETALYRIIQESLTNVVRHAEADTVSVLIECRDNSIISVIEDNGKGFDYSGIIKGSSLGLLGIQERTELLGGNLTIETALHQGTSLFVQIPMNNMEVATS